MITKTITVPFAMNGARDAIANGLSHIEEQVKGIERAVGENPGLAFDLAKTLIESVCRSVLEMRSIAFSPDDDLPKLFKTVTQHLPFLPPTESSAAKVRESLKKTLNGLSIAIQGICELRNQCGFASHGSSGPRPMMESVQALLAAQTADTIVGFLYRIHQQDQTISPNPELLYIDNPAFNKYTDEENNSVQIFDLKYLPSEVLFNIDLEAYRDRLADFSSENIFSESTPESGTTGTSL